MSGSSRAGQKTVLVIEDDEVHLDVVRELLEDHGYQVIAAKDGVEGLRALQTSSIDLIILDLMLPVMDGWSFLRELRREGEGAKTPVVVVSGFYDPRRELGAVRFLPKPLGLEALLRALRELSSPSGLATASE